MRGINGPLGADDNIVVTLSAARAILLAAIVTLSVSAGGATAAPAQTHSRWVSAANAACAKGLAPGHTLMRAWSAKPPATIHEWVVGFTRTIDAEAAMQRDLAALPRPAADARAIGEMLAWLGRALVEMRLVRRAELALDATTYHRHLDAAMADGKHFALIADRLGAAICAHG